MPVPLPPKPLNRHCTCLVGDQLYAYTGDGFYRLPIQHGGKWTELETVVNAQGAACLHIGEDTPDEALYVIGGAVTPSNDVPGDYAGLMRYRFNEGKWDILPKQDQALLNLTNHGVTYLEKSNQLMVFSGTKWPDVSTPSSQMFLVSTQAPYGTVSEPTGLAPPLLDPIVLPWGDNGGIILGGDVNNKQVYSFSADGGWKILSPSLIEGLPGSTSAGGVMINEDDGSKSLLTFDFLKVPVQVGRTVLQSGDAAGSTTIPNYNNTFAPQGSRSNFALAQNDKWVVVSGGGDLDDPLCIFNYQKNTWLNATSLLAVQEPLNLRIQSVSSSTSSARSSTSTRASRSSTSPASTTRIPSSTPAIATATPTSSASSTSSASEETSSTALPAGPGPLNANKTTTQLLFIILGVVILAGIILGIAYLLLRRKKKKLAAQGKGNGRSNKIQSVLSIQDRGVSYMRTDDVYKKPIVTEKNHLDAAEFQRKANAGGLDPGTFEMEDRQRSSGWSKYFSGNSNNQNGNQNGNLNRSISNASKSTYSMSSIPDDYDIRQGSHPAIGYVRSSVATSSAIFASPLPTPVVANISSSPGDHESYMQDRNNLSNDYSDVAAFPVPTITSTVPSMQFWSSSNFDNKPQGDADGSNHLWYAPSAGQPEGTRIPSALFPLQDPNRESAMTVFPGGMRDSPNPSLDFQTADAEHTRSAVGKNQNNLDWFDRFS